MNHWMHKKLAIGLVGLGLWSSSYSPSLADDHKVSVPKETKFVIHLDIEHSEAQSLAECSSKW